MRFLSFPVSSSRRYLLTSIAILLFTCVRSQDSEYRVYDPAKDPAFVVEGKAWPLEVKDFYDRLPARAEKIVRKPVWDLSKNSAGLQLRFVTNASEIVVKYSVSGGLQMPHMTATGVSGVDLYARDDKKNWLWAAGKFSFGDTITYRFTNLSPVKREYVLYLPLYNTVRWMQIYVPKGCEFTPLPASTETPVVVYGTSIAQGGCASRPGLGWTNILSRRLNRPVTNLAFSGNGKLEPELISLITEIDARVYVLDCLPNLTPGYSENELKKRIVNAVLQLQSKRPFTPILFTEHDGYTDGAINSVRYRDYTSVNRVLDKTIDSLKREGYKGLYLMKKEDINQDIETMVDGTHPNDIGMMRYADAYEKKLKAIFRQQKVSHDMPSIIPLPQQLAWKDGFFDLRKAKTLVNSSAILQNEANYLRKELASRGLALSVDTKPSLKVPFVELDIDKDSSLSEEAYYLRVEPQKITVKAKTAHGIFNGIQTLLQIVQGGMVQACEIRDWPAFSWRGYMVDVGRNYMAMGLLKQQIDVMARYKLNVFHFHSTEDIAWRFGISAYPQLTEANTMLRNKGKYYSPEEIKELIAYCKIRHITFVPEIDMPGHSAAFARAMKTNMQSDSGMQILKTILHEICANYDLQYVHIGADEVKITNKDFVPEMTSFIEKHGKHVIGWQPGGNYTNATIRQWWMDDNARHLSEKNMKFIDSRHLYLNHMDPLEAVVTIFNRRIADVEKGDSSVLGATLCMWNDRRVEEGGDILRMNPVYPGMLAFAERTWRGGGEGGWIANVDDGNVAGFVEFEKRLLDQKMRYFDGKAFAYVRQRDIQWNLYGPYDNGGELTKQFPPELSSNENQWEFYRRVEGGTVVLRHWWYPLIKAAVSQPKENSTFYAFTRIWRDEEGPQNFWIGFNNLSRSPATDSPPLNGWDDKHSQIWVNRTRIEPPHWRHAGQKGNGETPLIDEGYEYRQPTTVFLKKGWNAVLVKCPVGMFKGKDWQNPVKWMFTFVPSED